MSLLRAVEHMCEDGSDESKPILLSVLGKVFDVTKGKRFYAKGGSYAFFAGRDASRAYTTGTNHSSPHHTNPTRMWM